MAKVSIIEAAKLFGASPQGVRAWINAGMPATREVKKGKKTGKGGRPKILIDPEKARHWMIEKGVRTFLKSEIKQAEGGSAAPAKPETSGSKVNVEPGVDGAVDRLRAMELRAFSDYVRARNAGDILAQRSHMKLHSEAVRRMLEAEGVTDKRSEVEGQVWTEVEQSLVVWAEPVRSLIEQMPRALAGRCNVADPATAETALREWVSTQLFPMMNRNPKG